MCKHCEIARGKEIDLDHAVSFRYLAMRHHFTGRWSIDGYAYSTININYCPFCGRELEKDDD